MYEILDVKVKNSKNDDVEIKRFHGVGRIGKDPKPVKETTGGHKVCSGSGIVINVGKNETKYFGLNAWNATADNFFKLIKKGMLVEVIGRVTERKFEDKTYYDVNVDRFEIHDWGKKESTSANEENASESYEDSRVESDEPSVDMYESIDDIDEDDVPF